MTLALACAALAGCGANAPANPEKAALRSDPVRITQFYAAPPNPPRGGKGKLCYGVENAEGVTLDPPVDRVWPALARCIEIEAGASVTYTLTAVRGGEKVSQSLTVTPGPPALELIEVSINKLAVSPGEQVTVCYKAKNATQVDIRPGTYLLHRPDSGCVADRPRKNTTYVVTARGAGGQHDSERVTVKVK